MSLIERREPSASDLRWFGLLLSAFLGVVGGVSHWRGGDLTPKILWVTAIVVLALYTAFPAIRRPIVLLWGVVTYPISWLVTHLLVGAVYYLVLVPIALTMRLLGRRPLALSFDPNRESYWEKRAPSTTDRYFKQF